MVVIYTARLLAALSNSCETVPRLQTPDTQNTEIHYSWQGIQETQVYYQIITVTDLVDERNLFD